mmetsp:Transcript_125109/g.359216  ORF Transcript_125109/g.359216 Transcript_125109/m.359216 type:complete len:303 (+) Transcript_125109:1169-2077(+)
MFSQNASSSFCVQLLKRTAFNLHKALEKVMTRSASIPGLASKTSADSSSSSEKPGAGGSVESGRSSRSFNTRRRQRHRLAPEESINMLVRSEDPGFRIATEFRSIEVTCDTFACSVFLATLARGTSCDPKAGAAWAAEVMRCIKLEARSAAVARWPIELGSRPPWSAPSSTITLSSPVPLRPLAFLLLTLTFSCMPSFLPASGFPPSVVPSEIIISGTEVCDPVPGGIGGGGTGGSDLLASTAACTAETQAARSWLSLFTNTKARNTVCTCHRRKRPKNRPSITCTSRISEGLSLILGLSQS